MSQARQYSKMNADIQNTLGLCRESSPKRYKASVRRANRAQHTRICIHTYIAASDSRFSPDERLDSEHKWYMCAALLNSALTRPRLGLEWNHHRRERIGQEYRVGCVGELSANNANLFALSPKTIIRNVRHASC